MMKLETEHINYDMLPEHCRDGMRRYIEHGVIPESFLQAMICNEFVETCVQADPNNLYELKGCAMFLYWEIPGLAWKSEERMKAWAKAHRTEDE